MKKNAVISIVSKQSDSEDDGDANRGGNTW